MDKKGKIQPAKPRDCIVQGRLAKSEISWSSSMGALHVLEENKLATYTSLIKPR